MDRHPTTLPASNLHSDWRKRIELAAPLTIFLVSDVLGYISVRWLGEGYASLVFALGISIIGAISGLSVALVSAIAAAFVFNFLVAAPAFALRFTTTSDFVPPIVFALSAVLSGWLSGRLKDEVDRARRGAIRQGYLLDVSRALQSATSGTEIIEALRTSSMARSGIEFCLFEHDGDANLPVDADATPAAWQDIAHAIIAGGLETVRSDNLSGFGLKGSKGVVGMLIARTPPDQDLDDRFMLPLARIVGLALERSQLVAQVSEVRATARAEEFKSSLLASVSHDLRTPMTTIRTAASSLQTFGNQFDEDTSAQLLGGIVDECDRLNHLTSNLLEMSRLQDGKDSLRQVVLAVGEIVRSVTGRMEALSARARIAILAPREEVLVEVDPVLFELALVNIVQNALLYSPADSPVTVACSIDVSMCAISVTDEGSGISAADQDKVFRRFYRANPDRGAPKGTGLGLAIAKGFVEASGGTIAIASPVCDGRGTTVTLLLPLADSHAPAEQAAA